VSPASVVGKLEIQDDAAIALPEVAPPSAVPSATGIRVKGVGDLLVRFAKCCSPIPGDPITGYVTRGKGVTVHRANCPSVLSEKDIERLIDVDWDSVDPIPDALAELMRRPGSVDVPLDDVVPGEPEHAHREVHA
jgi:GTP pyrophosphokinase